MLHSVEITEIYYHAFSAKNLWKQRCFDGILHKGDDFFFREIWFHGILRKLDLTIFLIESGKSKPIWQFFSWIKNKEMIWRFFFKWVQEEWRCFVSLWQFFCEMEMNEEECQCGLTNFYKKFINRRRIFSFHDFFRENKKYEIKYFTAFSMNLRRVRNFKLSI